MLLLRLEMRSAANAHWADRFSISSAPAARCTQVECVGDCHSAALRLVQVFLIPNVPGGLAPPRRLVAARQQGLRDGLQDLRALSGFLAGSLGTTI